MLRVGTAMFTVRASVLANGEMTVTRHARVVSFHAEIMISMLLFLLSPDQITSINPLLTRRGSLHGPGKSRFPSLKKRGEGRFHLEVVTPFESRSFTLFRMTIPLKRHSEHSDESALLRLSLKTCARRPK